MHERDAGGLSAWQLQRFIRADVSFTSAAPSHFLNNAGLLAKQPIKLFCAEHFPKLRLHLVWPASYQEAKHLEITSLFIWHASAAPEDAV